MTVLLPCFEDMAIEQILGNVNTPAGRQLAGERHVQAWHKHMEKYGSVPGIRCIHTNATTGEETMVGFAEWFIYDKPRTEAEYMLTKPLEGLSEADQEKVAAWSGPVRAARVRWMGGRPAAEFKYVAVAKDWRRQGVATMCTRWGIERCRELGIPAYLEASEEGKPVYEKLGFEVMDRVAFEWGGQDWLFPAMVFWPPGTKDEDKVPAGSHSKVVR